MSDKIDQIRIKAKEVFGPKKPSKETHYFWTNAEHPAVGKA